MVTFPCRQYIFECWQRNSSTTENWDSNGHKLCCFRCDLFCFAYEYDFIVQLVNANRVDSVFKFSGTGRYINDLFCIDNNLFSNYLYVSLIDDQGLHGVYPNFLILNCEQESREQVSFLDVLIFRDGNIWRTKILTKRTLTTFAYWSEEVSTFIFFSVNKIEIWYCNLKDVMFRQSKHSKERFYRKITDFIRDFFDRSYPLKEIRNFVALQYSVKRLLNNVFKNII
jgi:hypothetical protein